MKDPVEQLSWSEFYKQSKNRSKIPTRIKEFNRLIAHTKNYFVISGYGAFTRGYMLIVSKDFIPSFGLIEKNNIPELNFLIKQIKDIINNQFDRNSVIFEHGMCACIGGLDRAHLHIMSIPKKSTKKSLNSAIKKVLFNRKAGIEYIQYKKYRLENIHDINQVFEDIKENKDSKN